MGYILDLPPTQDSSHHQDVYILSRESQAKPSFATVTGWGVDPRYIGVVTHLLKLLLTSWDIQVLLVSNITMWGV